MRCPLADDAAPAVPAGSSGHATPAVGLLRVPLKPGPKPRFSQEQKKARLFIIERPSHVIHCRQEEERIHTYISRRSLAELATLSLEYVLGQSPNKLLRWDSRPTKVDVSSRNFSLYFSSSSQIVMYFWNSERSYNVQPHS